MKVAQSELISVSIIRKVSLKLSLNLYSCCSVLLMHINRCVIEHYLCLHLPKDLLRLEPLNISRKSNF